MRKFNTSILTLSLLLTFTLLILGFFQAVHKPLWNDEINTQAKTLSQSYDKILLGKYDFEGNTAPLFYIQQKIFCDIYHFQTPQPWLEGNWTYEDPFANIFLRILPVFWMSSFFLLLFIYFSIRFNIVTGLLGLLAGLTSPILWLFWAEARPYGLWILLTGLQMILFLEILLAMNASNKKWLYLSIVHIFLSLTCILSVFQIGIICTMLLLKERNWLRYISLFAIPLLFILYYKPQSPSNNVIFLTSIQQMLSYTVSPERLFIFILYAVILISYYLQAKKSLPRIFPNNDIINIAPFFLSIFLMIITATLFLLKLQNNATGQGQWVTPRHIVFLAPVTIIGITYLAGLLFQNLKSRFWIKVVIMLVIIGLLITRLNEILRNIHWAM